MRVLAVRPAARCAICHDAIAPAEGLACALCASRMHGDCFDDVRCPTLGCPARRARPEPYRWIAVPPPEPVLASTVLGLIGQALRALMGVGVTCILFFGALSFVCRPCMDIAIRPRIERVRADMRAIKNAAALFRLDMGRWPQRLDELWERPAVAPRWSGPYLSEYPPRDPWSTPYLGVFDDHGVEVVSYGADGAPGGVGEAADLSSRTLDDRR